MIWAGKTPREQMLDALTAERFGGPVVKDWKPQTTSELALYLRGLDAGLIGPELEIVEDAS